MDVQNTLVDGLDYRSSGQYGKDNGEQ